MLPASPALGAWRRRLRVCVPLLAVTAVGAALAQVPEQTESFRIERLAEGVYAAVARPGAAAGANAAFIVNADDVVVVDTHMTPGAAAELYEAIGRITSRPVRFVVNTHWHPDHTQGNQAYAGAYPPGVTYLAHAATRADLATLGASRLAADLERIPREIASLEAQLAGLAAGEAMRTRREIERLRSFLVQLQSVELVLPSVTFDRALTLYRGRREIQLLYFGRGHTRGDLVVYLPRERIALVGDLVTGGPPFARDGYPIAWAETLERLARLDIGTVVSGHGAVRRDAR
ncbi:MAG TPA: MBL fold metallo-hydrolase, partial [Vicinamibacterales bacterium]|nr:MBL fold metallo-hydrolase [Vicinamibacterales bacterium]